MDDLDPTFYWPISGAHAWRARRAFTLSAFHWVTLCNFLTMASISFGTMDKFKASTTCAMLQKRVTIE